MAHKSETHIQAYTHTLGHMHHISVYVQNLLLFFNGLQRHLEGKIRARLNMVKQKVPSKCYVNLKGFEPHLFKNSAHISLVNKVRVTGRKELRKTHYC